MTQPDTTMIDQVFAPVANVRAEEIDGEILLYHPRQTKAIYLNPTAAVIWSLCDGHRKARDMIELIGESYPEAKDQLAEDICLTLQQLRDEGLLQVSV